MTEAEFYRSKTVVAVEWWLPDDDLPMLYWARLRVFSDGTADVCWEEGTTRYGFDTRDYASYFLSEDEYCRAADVEHCGMAERRVPTWVDRLGQGFKYFGTY